MSRAISNGNIVQSHKNIALLVNSSNSHISHDEILTNHINTFHDKVQPIAQWEKTTLQQGNCQAQNFSLSNSFLSKIPNLELKFPDFGGNFTSTIL